MLYSMPPDYVPMVGDIVSYDHRKNGRRGVCVIAEIVEPGFFLAVPTGKPDEHHRLGTAFHNDHHIIMSVQRVVKAGKRPQKIWEPPEIA